MSSATGNVVIDTRPESGTVFVMPADNTDYSAWLKARYEALKGSEVRILKKTYRQSLGGVNQAINCAIEYAVAGGQVVCIGPYAFEAAEVVAEISKGTVRPKVVT